MSGKPATPAASRARLLVYVAEPGAPEHQTAPAEPPARTHQHHQEPLYYSKTINDNSDKTFGAYGDNPPRVDLYAFSQTFAKGQTAHGTVDYKKVTDNITALKGDSMNNIEFGGVESFQSRVGGGANGRLKGSMQPTDNADSAISDYRCINYVDENVGQHSDGGGGLVNEHNGSEVTVPLGWRRLLSGTTVIYISPSGTALGTLSQIRDYLQTTGTCKCGLPCPLRPENTFSFDPKVASKPYQTPTGPELAKLCNHKRKLLATLQARGNSSGTPPPQADQKKGPEVVGVTKKLKRRSAVSNVRNQLVVQKDKQNDYKTFKDGDQCRAGSPNVSMRINSQSCPPSFNNTQQINTNIVPENNENHKTDYPIQRSSHYLTVNSGWINPESTQKPGTLNVGQPVIGTNGQIIGVNTGMAKGVKIIQPLHEHDLKDEKKVILELASQQMNQSLLKQSGKDDESQVYCGLNQALTPEVMQKINEQQHIFIQQNQKQIELAMKGFRTHVSDNSNYGKAAGQSNYVPQGHVVIQNGAVVKTNAKTPPWQVKRSDAQPVPSPSPNLQRFDEEYDDVILLSAEDTSGSSSNGNSSFNSSPSNDMSMCSRVPPLPQHYSMLNQQQHWPTESPKKKTKKSKKKANIESKVIPFGNNGLRVMDENKQHNEQSNIPSFMDDPNGYLAQQTALLNNTISRQVGMNHSYEQNHFDNSNTNYANNHIESDKSKMNPQTFRSNLVSNPSSSPNATPDSSVLPEKIMECCNKGCPPGRMNCNEHFSMRRQNYSRQNVFQKMDSEGSSANSSPKNSGDENPVTSSTYIERGQYSDVDCGVVSTSHVSERIAPSPTPSNSSRSTDTPHAQCTPSPAHSNPPTPGPPPITGTQLMHFISNHNVNKNLMEVGHISLVGMKSNQKKSEELTYADNRKRPFNMMPGYCPPPHLGGGPPLTLIQASYVQSYVTTMATGFSVTRDTITSVLAGKAQTATTSINASTANYIRLPPPPSVNLATSCAIPNNQPDPFINSVNLPTSYPLHIAGTTAQNMISKSPLEMVQNVIGSFTSNKCDIATSIPISSSQVKKSIVQGHPNQILISSSKQLLLSSGSPMPPPPPKVTSIMSPIQVSTTVTNSTTSINHSGTNAANNSVHTPTVMVNTLPTPFVLQPSMMSVDNQVVQQNNVLPQIVTGNLVTSRQSPNGSPQQIDIKSGQNYVQGVAMLSPESVKKKSKKKKNNHTTNVTNVLQITAPQQGNIVVHHTSPQHNTSPQFSPRGFQLSPNNNINSAPMLQALTIVPGKSGTSHIVMSGQGTPNNFGSQQIIQNTSPSQQINLLQPVNLLNNTGGVVSNFPTFQQFIVPNIGGMMMTTDGTIIQDNSTGVQLQLQTVNGQNVLTPVQNSNVFATGTNAGVVIRTQNQQGKIIQSQHSPGAQFLSPNSQVMVNSPNFNSQLSPLLANLSPTNVTYQNPHQIRSNVQQDFIQTNQIGQTMMVPLSPKSVNISSSNNRNNPTFVQQNTTIVQQQTTLVSNPHGNNLPGITQNVQGNSSSRLSIDPNILLSKQVNQIKNRNYVELLPEHGQSEQGKDNIQYVTLDTDTGEIKELDDEESQRHSVSTQTLVNSGQRGVKSPGGGQPDTTTHSPLGALEASCSPRLYSIPQQLNYADTTTKSPEPNDNSSLAMVQCVSSSEQDMADQNDHTWSGVPLEYVTENDTQNVISNMHMMRHQRGPTRAMDSYNQTISVTSVNNQQSITITPTNYYDRQTTYKRKNDFPDQPTYRQDKIIRTNYPMVHGPPKELEYDPPLISIPDTSPPYNQRHYMPQGNTSDGTQAQKRFERHNLGAGNDATAEGSVEVESDLQVGQVVWGPVKGYASWPGKLLARETDGRWTVRWFGADKATGQVPPDKLLTLTEGLEAHHAARTKHRKSRKLNINLENAIQEAMAELDKKSDQGVDQSTEVSIETEAEVTPAEVEAPKKQTKKCLGKNKRKR